MSLFGLTKIQEDIMKSLDDLRERLKNTKPNCTNCGAPLNFVSDEERKCYHCGTLYDG